MFVLFSDCCIQILTLRYLHKFDHRIFYFSCRYSCSFHISAAGEHELPAPPDRASIHLSPQSGSFVISVVKSINSDCEQQVDADWMTLSHHMWSDSINGSEAEITSSWCRLVERLKSLNYLLSFIFSGEGRRRWSDCNAWNISIKLTWRNPFISLSHKWFIIKVIKLLINGQQVRNQSILINYSRV